jgi:hypothetical protein
MLHRKLVVILHLARWISDPALDLPLGEDRSVLVIFCFLNGGIGGGELYSVAYLLEQGWAVDDSRTGLLSLAEGLGERRRTPLRFLFFFEVDWLAVEDVGK